MPTSQLIFDRSTELNLDLIRAAAKGRSYADKHLNDLIGSVLDVVLTPELTKLKNKDVTRTIEDAKAILSDGYQELSDHFDKVNQDIVSVSAKETTSILTDATANAIPINAPALPVMATEGYIGGAVSSEWWASQAKDATWRLTNAIKNGIAANETNDKIIRRIMAEHDVSRRWAATLVNTSVQTATGIARDATYEANGDIIKALEWVATLDRNTCLKCAPRDNELWDFETKKPIGHAIPYAKKPLHHNCRCDIIPQLKSFKELGIDLNEFPESTRASIEGQVNDKSFNDFMDRKGEQFQREQLGNGRYELYKKGNLTLDQLLNGEGNLLTIKQLKAKYNL